MKSKNIFGEPLIECSTKPITGFFRDGCCKTDDQDAGEHTVCIIASEEFLLFSKAMGNDLSTPLPQYSFAGVRPGDKWCLCAKRWVEAYQNGYAPKIVLEATNETLLELVPMNVLISYAYRKENSKIE